MSDFYQVVYTDQGGQHAGESIVPCSFRKLVDCNIASVCMVHESSSEQALDRAARKALVKYRMSLRSARRTHSRIEEAGMEFAVIRCYLGDMTIQEIVDWLSQHKVFQISNSVIGRFCTKLFRANIVPLRTIQRVKGHSTNQAGM